MTENKEFYILAGSKGLKDKLRDKGIEISPCHLLIVKEDSKLGRLIRKEAIRSFKNEQKNEN